MRFVIHMEVERKYGYESLEDLEVEELASLIFSSINQGLNANHIGMYGMTKIHRLDDEDEED